jgi:hypothetical protein
MDLTFHRSPQCCGVGEVYGITLYKADSFDAEDCMKAVAEAYFNRSHKFAVFYFEDVSTNDRVLRLESFIKEQDLGEVFLMSPHRNPNSGNMISFMAFAPEEGFKTWWDKSRAPDPNKWQRTTAHASVLV